MLAQLLLGEDAIELKGVDIVSEKSTIEQKIDRKIINVGKDLISAGATAGEIMNNIPFVAKKALWYPSVTARISPHSNTPDQQQAK